MAQFIPHVNPGVEAGDAIRQAIALQEAKRMAEIAAAQKMAQQNFENRISMGKLGVDQGRLGLDSNRFGLDVERFDRVDVPKSAADIANLNARTSETTQGVDIKNDARRIIGGLSKVGIGGRPSMSDAATLKLGGVDVMTPTAENFSVSPEQQGVEAGSQVNATAKTVDPAIIKGLFGAVPQQGGHVGLPGGLNVSVDSPRAPTGAQRELTPYQKLLQTRQLRNDFTRETVSARTSAQQLSMMKSAMEAAKGDSSPAGSQGVLVTFQKILDPTSVVRESEYARSGAGQSILDRMQGMYEKWTQGGAGVPVDEMQKFVTLAEQFARNQATYAARTREQINAIAMDAGIDPNLVTRDFSIDIDNAGPPTAAPAGGPKVGERRDFGGKIGVWDGKGWKPE